MTRLLTLLLIAQVKAEWVEISQQHYRKPIRTHSSFTTPDKVIDVEDATKSWSYNNGSVTEYNWNKNPARPPNIGNVKRVQHIGSTVKTTERVQLEEDDLDLRVDFRDYERIPNTGSTRSTIELYDKPKGTIERVPHVGNIKHIQLYNSPVKSPTREDREKYSNDRHKNIPQDDDNDEANDFKQEKNTETFRRIYVDKVKTLYGSESTATFAQDNDEDSSFPEETTFNTDRSKQGFKNHTIVRDFYSTKPTFITELEDFTNYETQKNRFYKITNGKSSEVTDTINVFTTELIKTGVDIVTKAPKLIKSTTAKANTSNVHKNIKDVIAEPHENNVQVSRNDEKLANPMVSDQTAKRKGPTDNDQPKQDHAYEKNTSDKNGQVPHITKAEKNRVNTMENVMKFMRVVADTISKNSRRSFGGKMQYLHELKESILANIEERIDTTWPDDDSAGGRRRSRSAHASPRGHGHVQFPSSESALMTISFLTFAVFLIKLVLQVIQTYKQKAMMVAPLMVASGRNVFTQHGHH